jgi:glycosyltransferase involved in cell wall biosynthesis
VKLVILIPAYNEEKNIEKTVSDIPRGIAGVDEVKILVVNDGSTDQTKNLAHKSGADKIISHKRNLGVGAAFMTGIRNAISMNADIVVTVDGDSQANVNDIPGLIEPILNNQFDVVIGTRFLKNIPEGYPKIKLIGNRIFTNLVSLVAGQKFTDSQTGLRAYSKEAITNISVVNDFTYTQEVLLDLKFKGYRIGDIPITVNYYRKDSKVAKNIFKYTFKSLLIILRSMIYHRPMLSFGLFGLLLIGGGVLAKLLTTYVEGFYITAGLSTGLIILGVVSFMIGGFASVVFKRQSFTEKEIRHFLKEFKKYDTN